MPWFSWLCHLPSLPCINTSNLCVCVCGGGGGHSVVVSCIILAPVLSQIIFPTWASLALKGCETMSSNNAFRHPPLSVLLNSWFQHSGPLFHHSAFLCSPTVITNLNTLLSKADWCRYCIHLRNLLRD
jgi:hypothetical protein